MEPGIKICLLVGVWGNQELHVPVTFVSCGRVFTQGSAYEPIGNIYLPLHISVTNRARKLKFGTLVVSYVY